MIAHSFEDLDEIDAKISQLNETYDTWRIKPGTLTVSRAFGDKMSKIINGKKTNLLISEPEIS